MAQVIRARAVVRGRVQGVGFRYAALSRARMLGAVGWVRNLPSGEVEVEVQGSPEVVENLIEWLRVGPRSAGVTDVRVAPATVDPEVDTFAIR